MIPLQEIGAGLMDLLFPPRCLTCGALAEPFCPECRARIRPLAPGMLLPTGVTDTRSVGYHEAVLREAVLQLKFSRKTALAGPLGELLADELEEVASTWQAHALVPVPIHWTRRWERGFNQSELLAGVVAHRCGLPVRSALRRTRATPPQVGLTGAQRATNLRSAFAVDSRHLLPGGRFILVDDVTTTGATLAECASVLRGAGAAEVFALTVTYDV